jgi:DNA polymerase (family X)
MFPMKNYEISAIFNSMADILEIKGENPFRVRAYRRAAVNIDSWGADVSSLSVDDILNIPGIGRDLASKIEEYIRTGRIEAYERLKQQIPEGVIALLRVPGLGPKTVRLLYEKYLIEDIGTLERLARENKLSIIPGIKGKTEGRIIKGIEMLKRDIASHPIARILPIANDIISYLSVHAPIDKLAIAGSIRRWKERVGDIDIVATSRDSHSVMKAFSNLPGISGTLMKGPTKSSIVRDDGIVVDIRVVDPDNYGAALAYFTGSKTHNIKLREIAAKAGLLVNEYGIFRGKDGKKLGGQKEEEIYDVLGLHYIPPELREDTGEIESSSEGTLPQLVEIGDIKGDLHIHSDWNDGEETPEDLIKLAIDKGYTYIAVTDHSKGRGAAGGLNEERIVEQMNFIGSLNKKMKGFRLLTGAEVNIKSDGSLNLDDDIIKKLDIVVAAVHFGFRQPRGQMTRRIVTAMKNPYVSVFAHPTGKLTGESDGYEVDMDEILKTASETGTAIEINASSPNRDLNEANIRAAKLGKVKVVISSGAYNRSQFDNMMFGVAAARRGWLEKKDVLNTLDKGRLLRDLKKTVT